MKAVICIKYGSPDVLEIQEVEKPSPKKNEVLIKIFATSVHIGDTKIRSFKPGMGPFLDLIIKPIMRVMIGFRGPRKKILGMELAGEIVSVGENVSIFKQGDRVFATTELSFGTYAQYTCMPENGLLTTIPSNMGYKETAPVSNGGATALILLKKAKIKQGDKILIYGASGSVGTFAVQIAKVFGAEVTAVCSTTNLEMVESLGADKTIDYTKEDFTNNDEEYDVIFDAVGKVKPSDGKKSLEQNGTYLNVLTSTSAMVIKLEDLIFLKDLLEAGKLHAVIDRTYSLDEIVEAHRYVEKGHKKGNVVIRVVHDD